ncbi:MAG: GNAT family N-acetyltransferase [Bacilli bacterium]|nr:GNAT family N-acetyltransferase [Bacilli bacterium]
MIYRKANIKDAKEVDSLLTKLIADERQYDPKCELVIVKDYYINFIEDSNKYLFVCEDNNNIVGYIYSIIEEDNAKIDALFVLEEYRNKGIATKLIEDFISYAKDNNIKQITINVLSNNLKARKLYLKYFKPYKKENNKETLLLKVICL